ncbi:MAG TPA: hypothetical protein ENJ95_08575 [Bacteroidetes bacterium]|nr:hypothetical protein [Bacteroidota bacterium]
MENKLYRQIPGRFLKYAFLLFLPLFFGCFEPKEGCLNINATNYAVDADDPCADCCTLPTLTLSVRHVAELPNDTVAFRYGTLYPSLVDGRDSFVVDRAHFFISNIKLVKEGGGEVGVTDTLRLEFASGEALTIEDNFAKLDRDIFAARKVGTIITEGNFTKIKLTLGLEEFLLQNDLPTNIPPRHPLNISEDSLIFEAGTGYIPNLLIFRPDTLPETDSLIFHFLEPTEITLPLESPFYVEKGFDVKLTLKVNYEEWFRFVDFENDSPQAMMEQIGHNLPNVFAVAEIKLE